jgi:hypothetical protein
LQIYKKGYRDKKHADNYLFTPYFEKIVCHGWLISGQNNAAQSFCEFLRIIKPKRTYRSTQKLYFLQGCQNYKKRGEKLLASPPLFSLLLLNQQYFFNLGYRHL